MLRAITEKEVEKRMQFIQKYAHDRTIPLVIFPGLKQRLPIATVQIEDFDTELPKIETDSHTNITFGISQRDPSEFNQLQEEISRLKKDNDRLLSQISTSLSPSSVSLDGDQTQRYQKRILDLEKILFSSRNEVESLKLEKSVEIVRLQGIQKDLEQQVAIKTEELSHSMAASNLEIQKQIFNKEAQTKLEKENELIQNKLAEVTTLVDGLQTKLKLTEDIVSSLNEQLVDNAKTTRGLETENKELKEKLEIANEKVTQLEVDYKEKNNFAQQLQISSTKITQLELDLAEKNGICQKLEKETNELCQKLEKEKTEFCQKVEKEKKDYIQKVEKEKTNYFLEVEKEKKDYSKKADRSSAEIYLELKEKCKNLENEKIEIEKKNVENLKDKPKKQWKDKLNWIIKTKLPSKSLILQRILIQVYLYNWRNLLLKKQNWGNQQKNKLCFWNNLACKKMTN